MFTQSVRLSSVDGLHEVVVVDPVDRDEDEAQDVREQPPLLVEDVAEVVVRIATTRR